MTTTKFKELQAGKDEAEKAMQEIIKKLGGMPGSMPYVSGHPRTWCYKKLIGARLERLIVPAKYYNDLEYYTAKIQKFESYINNDENI